MQGEGTLKIRGKAVDFRDMLSILSCGKWFETAPLYIQEAEDGSKAIKAAARVNRLDVYGLFHGFEIEGQMAQPAIIDIQRVTEYINFYDGGDDIELEVKQGILTIRQLNTQKNIVDFFEHRLKSPEGLKEELLDDFRYQMDGDIALFKKGQVRPTTTIHLNTTLFNEIFRRADKVGADEYSLTFDTDGTIKTTLLNKDTNDKAEPTIAGIKVEGQSLEVKLTPAIENVCKTISGEVRITGLEGSPLWLKRQASKYTVFFMIPIYNKMAQ